MESSGSFSQSIERHTFTCLEADRQKEYRVSVFTQPKYIQESRTITIKCLCLVRGSCRHQPTTVSLASAGEAEVVNRTGPGASEPLVECSTGNSICSFPSPFWLAFGQSELCPPQPQQWTGRSFPRQRSPHIHSLNCTGLIVLTEKGQTVSAQFVDWAQIWMAVVQEQ